METVSVIMPCFNDGKYIEHAVASLRNQTYRSVELVIVDDGSDDRQTAQILRDIAFPCMKLIRSGHEGPASARNKGIAACSGALILPLDADDAIEPTYIEKAVKVMEENPAAGIVYCQASFFGAQSGKWMLPPYSLKEMLAGNVIFASAMFRKAAWESVGGYNEAMRHGLEDYDFWLSLLEKQTDVYQIPEVLFHYRIKPVSRSSLLQRDISAMQEAYRRIYSNHKSFFSLHNDLYVEALREKSVRQAYDMDRLQEAMKLFGFRHACRHLILSIPGVRAVGKRLLRSGGSRKQGGQNE